jgi:UDP-N-acetylmuramoylalanine--D-glutamate ligase
VRTLRGKTVVVLGLGKSGLAAARLLVREGAKVIATDSRTAEDLGSIAAELGQLGATLELGGHRTESFTSADLIVKSPGIGPKHPQLVAARDRGVPIIGEVELCTPWLQYPVIGITGTNGKSTTTALTGHLLTTAGFKVFVGGNLGTPIAEQVLEGQRVDATVLELSSYQVDDLIDFRCDVAMVLNLTPDHLERYGTMENYAASKARLLSLMTPNGVAILNGSDEWTKAMKPPATVRTVMFGHGAARAGFITHSDGTIVRGEERYTVASRALKGAHNFENAMAAIEAARVVGASPEAIQRGLDTYPGLPHRIEFIRSRGGVDWINDSKATNVDSVEKSLTAFNGPLHLIMGGKGKGAPYAPLRSLFPGRVKRLYVIGADGSRIADELGDLAPVERVETLTNAVEAASRLAKPGETVLLSPACASFDQFKSFEHRGSVFREAVERLPEVP